MSQKVSSPKTPKMASVALVEKVTPKEVHTINRLVTEMSPNRAAISSERRVLKEGISRLDDFPDTPQKKRKATKISEIGNAVVGRFTDVATNIEDNHKGNFLLAPLSKSAYEDLAGTWPQDTLHELRIKHSHCQHKDSASDFPYLFNISHVTAPSEKKSGALAGYHFAPNGHPHPLCHELNEVITNPANGVWVGEFRTATSNASKQSTFFPKNINTEQELLTILRKGTITGSTRGFLLVHIEEHNIYVEALRNGSNNIASLYPIFFFGEYKENTSLTITPSLTITADNLFAYANQAFNETLKKADDGARYRFNNRVIVDIAPFIPNQPIKTGILLSLPEKVMPAVDEDDN